MQSNLPPLIWLRAFEAAARHLSFTLAAQELHLTQAAVSKHVKLLEHHLHEPLFERLPRSLALTKAGAAYLPKVQDSFDRLGAGTREVFGGRKGNTLTIRVPVGYGINWLAARLPRFVAAHPDIPLRIISSVWNEDSDGLRYDLDIFYGVGNWVGYTADRLTSETLEPVCTPQIANRLSDPTDLQGETLLHVLGYQDGWATWLAATGTDISNAGSGVHFDTSSMALEMAANGGGVALGRRSMVERELKSGRLVAPFDKAVSTEEGFWLLAPIGVPLASNAATFREWLLQEIDR